MTWLLLLLLIAALAPLGAALTYHAWHLRLDTFWRDYDD